MSILRLVSTSCVLVSALAFASCGGGSDTPGTGGSTTTAPGTGGAGGGGGAGPGTGGSGGAYQAAQHAALPQVVSVGGSVLAHPKVQPIVYAGDPHTTDVTAFLKELTTTSYWSETTSEYGVGALQILPTITLTDPAPAKLNDSDLTDMLAAQTGGASPVWGAADPSTIYLFVLPKGTKVDAGGLCCDSYDGYHDEATVGSTSVPYAVTCSCPGLDGPSVDEIQQLTVVISHELIEAATDPMVETDPAFWQSDDADLIWTVATGGEAADMCEFNLDTFVIPKGAKYMVQKSWSNAAAKAGKQPCLPSTDGAPFFGAAPVLSDMVSIQGSPAKTQGVKLAVGQSTTIDVQLFSTLPTSGPFTVTAYDLSSDFYGDTKALDLQLDKTTGQNGDVLKLTIKLLNVDNTLGTDGFVLEADLGTETSLFMGAVNTH